MTKAMHWGLIGLAIGFTTFLLIMWVARKKEREARTQEEAQAVQGLKILAVADLILIPSLMYWFGTHAAD